MWNTLDVSSLFRSSVGGEINRAAFNDSINVSELELVTICAVNHRWTTQIALIVIPFFFLSAAKNITKCKKFRELTIWLCNFLSSVEISREKFLVNNVN